VEIKGREEHFHDELTALELTQQVEEAKETLRGLRETTASGAEVDQEATEEVRRLEAFITEHSKRAERSITSSSQESDG